MSADAILAEFIPVLAGGESLCEADARAAARAFAEEGDVDTRKAFLIALAEKGETAEEVSAFASVFRELARDPDLGNTSDLSIDVCGTGGDGSHTFNISTVVSFVLAARGLQVYKHGNRSITSSCGSADLLEASGIQLEAPAELLKRSMQELNFVFLFAPAYHPAFRHVMPVRKALGAEGKRSIFNILGPLINPAAPRNQLLGVFHPQWVEPLAKSLHRLGLERAMVVCTEHAQGRYMDELSTAGEAKVVGFRGDDFFDYTWSPKDFGLNPSSLDALAGGDKNENLELLKKLLNGDADTALVDSIAYNAASAMWLLERVDCMEEGLDEARTILTKGQLAEWLNKVSSVYA